jgi:hypothetical protein
MRKLLWAGALATLGGFFVAGSAFSYENIGYTVIPSDAVFASWVFVGPDQNMPVAPNRYYVSINPSRSKSGQLLVPKTIEGALLELNGSLPRWILNTLARSSGDFECTVTVSEKKGGELDYYVFLEDWYWINWNLQNDKSPLRQDFARRHIMDRFMILQALRAGICKLAKTGSKDEAIKTIDKYGGTTN